MARGQHYQTKKGAKLRVPLSSKQRNPKNSSVYGITLWLPPFSSVATISLSLYFFILTLILISSLPYYLLFFPVSLVSLVSLLVRLPGLLRSLVRFFLFLPTFSSSFFFFHPFLSCCSISYPVQLSLFPRFSVIFLPLLFFLFHMFRSCGACMLKNCVRTPKDRGGAKQHLSPICSFICNLEPCVFSLWQP